MKYLCFFLVAVSLLSCNSKHSLAPLDDYRFVDIYGQRRDDTTGGIYSLQCSGWRAPKYKTDSMVWAWTNKYPEANVFEVCSFTSEDPQSGKQLTNTYCWIISKNDTINTWLVRNGACPAATMLWPDGFNKFITTGYDSKQKMQTTVNIDEAAYKTFCNQLKSAEDFAQSHKLGIWSLPDSLRR